jgi:hypothetical protein
MRVLKSTGFSPAARTLTSNCPAAGFGIGTFMKRERSGPPYPVITKAFICSVEKDTWSSVSVDLSLP